MQFEFEHPVGSTFTNVLDFFKKKSKVEKFSKHKFEIRTVSLEVGIVLGILKKLLKTSNTVLMHRNSIERHFSTMFHAKNLLPWLDNYYL